MTVKTALRDMNNAVLDLQAADYNTFERPLERLALALNDDDLKQVSQQLKSKANLDTFLEGTDQGYGMMGSARLNWPSDRQEEMGLVLQIIERSAQNPQWFLSLAHTYYYSGRKIIGDIRKITAAVIIPFNRDFATYIDEFVSEISPNQSEKYMSAETNTEADKEDLLDSLFELAQTSGKRPSVLEAGLKYLPEWETDRLFNAAQALEKEGSILNRSGAMVNVDLSSTSRKRVEQRRAAANASGVTYNIRSMNQSPLQHISTGAHGVQNISYSANDLKDVVELYRKHIDELQLDAAQRRKADAQIATIEAQLIDQPDPTIVQAAGKSLKTIIEGAIAGATGNAIASAHVWSPLLSMFG